MYFLIILLLKFYLGFTEMYVPTYITPHDYLNLDSNSLQNNPPSCGIPYTNLDINRITAIQYINVTEDCGACIRVINNQDKTKFIHVLVVDTGGKNLDVILLIY